MRFFSLVLILATCLQVQANEPEVSHWSLRYLARASNALLVASQQSLEHQKAICGISGSKISQLSQNLKALIDAKISSLNTAQKTAIRQQSATCFSECSCDIFAYSFEGSSSPEDQKALEQIRSSVDKINTDARLACAKNFPEFCSSHLLKSISK